SPSPPLRQSLHRTAAHWRPRRRRHCRIGTPCGSLRGEPVAGRRNQSANTRLEKAGTRRRKLHLGRSSMSINVSPSLRKPLIDSYERVHRDLRISLTDVCNLRCTYCMPAEGVEWMARANILTTDELVRTAEVAAALGIVEVRLTGGEPLLRPDAVEVVRRLAAVEGEDGPLEISMTTNALRLPKLAPALKEAGLARVNISLDTLKSDTFSSLTRRDRMKDTFAGIDAAVEAGFRPLKFNAVAMRGVNEDELVDLVNSALSAVGALRFVEQLPLDAEHIWSREKMVTREEILERLSEAFELPEAPDLGAAPAEKYLINGGPATIGFIRSVTRSYCGACDRVRLTAHGQIRNCLFARTESDLLGVLRSG